MSAVTASYDITVSEAYLVGTWVEGPLLGLNIAMYAVYTHMLVKSGGLYSNALIGIATLQLVVAAAHYATMLPYLIEGLIAHSQDLGGSDKWFANPTQPLFVASSFFYVTNVLLGDCILAWRCYVVWGRSRLVGSIFLVMVMATIVVVYVSLAGNTTLKTAEDIFVNYRMMTASFAMSVAIQTAATTAIVWKLYRSTAWKYNSNGATGRLAVMWIVIESGALLSLATALLLGTFVVHMNAGFIISCFLAQMSFMVPTSFMIRSRIRHGSSTVGTVPLPGYSLRPRQSLELRRRCDDLGSFDGNSVSEGILAPSQQSTAGDIKASIHGTTAG